MGNAQLGMAKSRVSTIRSKNLGGWQRPFDDPIPLPRGRQLVTLRRRAIHHQAAESRARIATMGNRY